MDSRKQQQLAAHHKANFSCVHPTCPRIPVHSVRLRRYSWQMRIDEHGTLVCVAADECSVWIYF